MLRSKAIKFALLGLIGMIGLSIAWARQTAESDGLKVQETSDLQSLAARAKAKGVPMLVLFSQRGCVYCEIVENDFLIPMLRNTEYDSKVMIRKIRVDNFNTVRNFDGTSIASSDLSTHYRAVVTPTVVFLGSDGKELSRRIVGMSNEYFYGEELDKAIDQSLLRIHQVALNQRR